MYLLHSPNGQAFNLSFEYFNLQTPQNDECVDYVKISNGTNSQKFCGSYIPGPFTSTGGNVTLEFKTDSSGNEGGFEATACCSVDLTMTIYTGTGAEGSGEHNM